MEEGSSSIQTQLQCKTLTLDNCHACGRDSSPVPLKTLDSLWRIVFLCPDCSESVLSAKLCSYCLKGISQYNDCGRILSCSSCTHHIHSECASPALPDPFTCTDCWLPVALSKRISPNSSSGSTYRSVESLLQYSKPPVTNNAKKKPRKAVKSTARLVRDALSLIGACPQDIDQMGILPVPSNEHLHIDDKELALILHRAINCSERASRRTQRVNFLCFQGSKMTGKVNEQLSVTGAPKIAKGDSAFFSDITSLSANGRNERSIIVSQQCNAKNVDIALPVVSQPMSSTKQEVSPFQKRANFDCDRYSRKYARKKCLKANAFLNGMPTSKLVYVRKCSRRLMNDISTSESAVSDKKPNSNAWCNDECGTSSDGSSKSGLPGDLSTSGCANSPLDRTVMV